VHLQHRNRRGAGEPLLVDRIERVPLPAFVQTPECHIGRHKELCVEQLLAYLTEYCDTRSISELMVVSDGKELDAITIEVMDGYATWRNKKAGWSWAKGIEVLRQFFIIAACDKIGLYSYDRLRARAMVLLIRYEGTRVSDVLTLSREHIQGNHQLKRAVKNAKLISVALHPEVQKAIEALPRPKAVGTDCQLYFTSENSSLRSSVKGAQRTLWACSRSQKRRAHIRIVSATRSRRVAGQGSQLRGDRGHPGRQPHHRAPPLCQADSGVPDAPGPHAGPGPWHEFSHKFGTDGNGDCKWL
jgi:integrase